MEDIYSTNTTGLSLFQLNRPENRELFKEFYRRDPTGFYWGPEPKYRGSWTIIRSTIFTIFIVSWRLVNLDVYATAKSWQRVVYKGIWLLSAIISPVTVSLYARRQLLEARDIQRYYRKNVLGRKALQLEDGPLEDGPPTGHQDISTAQFTNGYSPVPKLGSLSDYLEMNAAFLLISGGFMYDQGDGAMIISPSEFKRLLDERQFGARFEGLAHIPGAITDKEKVETFAKVIIAVQLCSKLLDAVARKFTPIPSVLLELHAGTVLCAGVFICLYWWNKPFGITTPVKLKVVDWDRCMQIREEENRWKPRDDNDGILGIFRRHIEVLRDPHDIHYVVNVTSWALLCFMSWGIFSDLFFFTDIELWVWRFCSIGAASPLLLGLTLLKPSVRNSRFYKFVFPFVFSFYFLGCVGMFIIALISIRNPPLGAFKVVPWISYIPSF